MPENTEPQVTQWSDPETFARVLKEAATALESAEIPFAVFGGIATVLYSRPRSTHDIDFLVRPDDADRALDTLAEAGFETERTKPRWLYKAFRDGAMVDVIFRVRGDIYLDEPVIERSRIEEFEGVKVRLVSPEDTILIEALSHGDDRPEHWYNALAIIARETLDWEYLLQRARHGPRRILSLLIYAQSSDLVVPDNVIRKLYLEIYGESRV